jgi:hypothetical protein
MKQTQQTIKIFYSSCRKSGTVKVGSGEFCAAAWLMRKNILLSSIA